MRRFSLTGSALAVALLFSGCDSDARRLAKEAHSALSEYRKELDRQSDIERRAYRAQSGVEAEAARDQAFSELDQEKIERARSLAADAIEGRWSTSKWRSALREYAEADIKVRRDLLAGESERQVALTSRLAALQLSKDRIDALSKALKDLSENPKLFEEAKSAGDFTKSVMNELDKKAC